MDSKKVLIVDDDPRLRRLMSITLRNRGYTVLEAEDGDGAIEMIDSIRPDAIVLDVMLPNKSGFDLCSDLKADPRTRGIKILILSGIARGIPGGDRRCRDGSRADGFISKPFNLSDLVSSVAGLLGVPSVQPTGPS